MKRTFIAVALALLPLTVPATAQLLNKEAPVIVGHYHLNVSSVAEHQKFWVDTLGGTAMKIGGVDVVKFPDVYLFLNVQKPSGPARGSALDHIGFAAPNVPAIVARITAAGYMLTNGREPAPGAATAGASGAQPQGGAIAYVMGPEGAKIEIVTNREANAPPLKHHHVHYINKQYVEMRDWYVRALNATERTGPNTFTDFFAGADLPGVGYMLNYFRWEGDQSIVHAPTAGRVYDHVGYEVTNLEAFTKGLEAKGIKLTRPYRVDPATKIASAMTVDPWGVGIELTEGLRALP